MAADSSNLEAALNRLETFLTDAVKHAEYDLDIAVNRRTSPAHSVRVGWTPSTSTATLRLDPTAINAAARANAYAAAVRGNAKLAAELLAAARAGATDADKARQIEPAAACAERIAHAASTCGSLEGAEEIVYEGYATAVELRFAKDALTG